MANDDSTATRSDVQELTYSIGVLADEIGRLVTVVADLKSSLAGSFTVVHEHRTE